jgi:chromosome partitioning protein
VSDARDFVSRANAIFARLRSTEREEEDSPTSPSDSDPASDPPSDRERANAESEVETSPAIGDHADAGEPPPFAVETEPVAASEETAETTLASEHEELLDEAVSRAAATAAEATMASEAVNGDADAPTPDPQPDLSTLAEPASPEPLPPRPLPRVIAIANQKGGVGKTTTAVNLGAALAELEYRVLVVDLDPQGNATTGLGINPRNLQVSIYDVMMNDTALEDCVEPTAVRNLFVAPATIDLAGAEIELVPAFSRELKLRRALDAAAGEFDFTLIDCPPSLGLLTVNGLAAAAEVIVPIQCEYYALEGLGQLLRNVALVQTNLNPRLELSAIVLTMYDARTRLAEQVANEVREHFGAKVCRNIVPRTVRLSEAPSFGQPVTVFDPSSRGAIAYRELAKEVSGGAPQRTG